MPHIGTTELIIILVIVFVIFGVGKLPQIGGALGKGIREFRKAKTGEEEEEKPKEAVKAAVSETTARVEQVEKAKN